MFVCHTVRSVTFTLLHLDLVLYTYLTTELIHLHFHTDIEVPSFREKNRQTKNYKCNWRGREHRNDTRNDWTRTKKTKVLLTWNRSIQKIKENGHGSATRTIQTYRKGCMTIFACFQINFFSYFPQMQPTWCVVSVLLCIDKQMILALVYTQINYASIMTD